MNSHQVAAYLGFVFGFKVRGIEMKICILQVHSITARASTHRTDAHRYTFYCNNYSFIMQLHKYQNQIT